MSRRLLLAAAVGILAGPVAAQISVTSRAAIDGSYGLEIQTDGSGRAMYAITNKAALYPSLDVQ